MKRKKTDKEERKKKSRRTSSVARWWWLEIIFPRFSLPKFIVSNRNQSACTWWNFYVRKRRREKDRQRDDKVFPFGLYMLTFLMPSFVLEYTHQQQQIAIQSMYICQYRERRKANCNMTCEWQHWYCSLLSFSLL